MLSGITVFTAHFLHCIVGDGKSTDSKRLMAAIFWTLTVFFTVSHGSSSQRKSQFSIKQHPSWNPLCLCVWYHFVHDIYFCTLKGHFAISVAITSGSAGGHSDNTNTQSAHSIQSQMETTHQSRPVMKPVHSLLLLCVFQWGDVMYGDCSGSTGDAELLYAVFFHAVQLSPGELEAVFWGWVWVDNAAWHGGDAHMTQWHAASTCGLRHLLTSFGTTTGSQDPCYVCPPGNIKNMMFPQVLP